MSARRFNTDDFSAEYYAKRSSDADNDTWLVYDDSLASRGISIDSWLERHRPSEVLRSDGIGWISVQMGSEEELVSSDMDLEGLFYSWEALKKSARPVNIQTISELARNHCVTVGKWMCFMESGPKVELTWGNISRNIVNKKILARSAKVCPYDPAGDGRHVVCVYNNNFCDVDQVFQLEKDLRAIGLKCPLVYKPDIFSYIGIYRNNEWGLSPTLYTTMYDVVLRDSKLMRDKVSQTLDM